LEQSSTSQAFKHVRFFNKTKKKKSLKFIMVMKDVKFNISPKMNDKQNVGPL